MPFASMINLPVGRRTTRLLATTALLVAPILVTPLGLVPAAYAQGYTSDQQGAAQETVQPGAAVAAQAPSEPVRPVHASISLNAGSGQVIHLHAAATNVFTADPKVAEIRPASANSLFIFGVAPGTTTVAALSSTGEAIAQYQVTVTASGFDAAQARTAIQHGGSSSVTTRATETGVSISGHVATAGDAERAGAAARLSLPPDGKMENRLVIDGSVQVGLHVRIAEMTRTLTRDLGVNWSSAVGLGKDASFGVFSAGTNTAISAATGVTPSAGTFGIGKSGLHDSSGNPLYNLETIIDALSQDQLVHVLAEPNLTTTSGQPASFLVGGEFPIPVATSNNTVSIEFKQYGISLAFVPTVISNNRISLHVRPEVSQLDKANGVTSTLGSSGVVAISIPALTVRRADTTVELGSGQSFAIAGLLSDQTTQVTQATPGLGDLPILGALFRSDSFQRAETELVIVVTPYIVRPVSDPNAIHTAADNFHAPNDLERILLLRQLGRGSSINYGRIPADAGFIVE
jgi:pilus assembly protein CpaC